MSGGTGQKLTYATTVVAGVASLTATLLSLVYVHRHSLRSLDVLELRNNSTGRYGFNCTLPGALLGRWNCPANVPIARTIESRCYSDMLFAYCSCESIFRTTVWVTTQCTDGASRVPIYSISSWISLVSFTLAQWIDPIRDIYEAFTIYTFFQLLINYVGGERALIIMTHGRKPVNHLWPLNHVLGPVDISDPYTFLAIKRGILQYAWMKPVLGLSAIVMKATGTYQEGYIAVSSGYLWSGIIYNISVSVSLYSLAMFWVCMHEDLKPFRPVPKFLCIKLIIFASYWQGFALSILVWLGAIPDNVQGYTQDNLAAAIQDALICVEMPVFAVAHLYAFSWHDFADNKISAARLPVWYAIRDAFGPRDLIEDTKETFSGDKYKYRQFDSGDKILAHEASKSRLARLKAGMRYERGGRGKYWLPNPNEIGENTSLLRGETSQDPSQSRNNGAFDEEPTLDQDEEELYDKARNLEFGDWNVSALPSVSLLWQLLTFPTSILS